MSFQKANRRVIIFYKYLGISETDKFLEEKMKLNVLKEYIRG